MCLKLLRSFMFPFLKQGVKSREELGSVSIKFRIMYSPLCPCRGSQGRWGAPGQAAVPARKGKDRAALGHTNTSSFASLLGQWPRADAWRLITRRRRHPGKKILSQKSSHHSGAYPPMITLSSVNLPNQFLNPRTFHSAWMTSVLGGASVEVTACSGAGHSVAKEGVVLPRHSLVRSVI